MTNPFTSPDGAARYAAGRPDVQPLLLERVQPFLVGTALGIDVACGTGQCSVALADLVGEVLAFDVSASMLARARPHKRVKYALAAAEALPVPDHCADVLTVCMGFHWFERGAFSQEARRVLRPGGVLAILDSFFAAELVGHPQFGAVMERYGAQYPPPRRDSRPFGEAQAQAAGFSFHSEKLTHLIPFSQGQLVAYLLTHSNTIAVTDAGRETPQQVRDWLDRELTPLLPDGQVGEFVFGAEVRVLRPL
ncbi:methyltransferase domain-containing protein [Deinococcus sp.]|uniref:class I SAM-dependent methyltransferase n=1 Tax=Deinococcus sp. TaxID=47478 RepID=UPI0025E4EF00|nr:methyltransferase domain-containing protein [Deinococcus sp.]